MEKEYANFVCKIERCIEGFNLKIVKLKKLVNSSVRLLLNFTIRQIYVGQPVVKLFEVSHHYVNQNQSTDCLSKQRLQS